MGIALGVLVAFGGVIAARKLGGGAAVAAILFGATIGLFGYVAGVLLSAQGQILKASLDTAVNSSAFVRNHYRLRMMSL